MFRALTKRVAKRWRFVSFRGAGGGEWRGVIDVLAVRKSTTLPRRRGLKRGDLLDFILVQLKGGDAAVPSSDDIRRLRIVARSLGAQAVVLYSWKRGTRSTYEVLARDSDRWTRVSAESLFG